MALTRKIASGGTVANFSTYVGEKGHLFYNSDTGDLRISDGVTVGGNSLTLTSSQLGDLHIYGSNITTVNANEDLNLVSNGTGNVNIYGSFVIHDGGSLVPFFVTQAGAVTISNPNLPVGSTALNIIGSSTGATLSPGSGSGSLIHLTGNDSTPARFTTDAFGGSGNAFASWVGRAARGTAASPAALQAGDIIARISAIGWAEAGFNTTNTGGPPTSIDFIATDNLTHSVYGSAIKFYTSPQGSIGRDLSLTVNSTGITTVTVSSTSTTNSTSSTTGAVTTAGGLGVAQDAWIGGSLWADDAVYSPYFGSIGNGSTTIVQGGSDGTGTVQVLGDQFDVRTTTNANPVFQVNGQGEVKILAPTFDSSVGAVSIVGSATGNTVNPQQGGVMLHVTGQPGTPGRVYVDGAGAYAAFIGRMYNGTSDSPTGLLNNQILSRFAGTPYTSSGWPTISTVRVDMVTSETQTLTNQGNRIELWTTPVGSATIQKIITVDSNGITFAIDGSVQNTAGIPLTQKGAANGVATLDSTGKVTAAQLPAGAVTFQGTWSAASNTPTLANGTGTAGYEYVVTASGTVNFGAGNITFTAGDFVIYNGSIWQRIPTGGLGVTSFNTRTGAVTLSSSDVTTALTYTPYNGSTNPNGYVNSSQAASAAPVQSVFGRTGTVTLQSSDVTGALTSGSIANSKLANSTIVVNGVTLTLGDTNDTITAAAGTLTGTTLASNVVTSSLTTVGTIVTGVWNGTAITNSYLANSTITHSAGTGISITGGTTSLGGTVTITNSGVTSIVAGYDVTVSGSTGAVTVNSLPTVTSTTTTSGYTVDFTGPGMVTWAPTANGNQTITLTNYTAGRIVRLFITPHAAGDTYTVTGLTVGQSFNGKNNFKLVGGVAGLTSMIAEFYCTTSAEGGVYLNVVNGQ